MKIGELFSRKLHLSFKIIYNQRHFRLKISGEKLFICANLIMIMNLNLTIVKFYLETLLLV
jgi:hypothetical protein